MWLPLDTLHHPLIANFGYHRFGTLSRGAAGPAFGEGLIAPRSDISSDLSPALQLSFGNGPVDFGPVPQITLPLTFSLWASSAADGPTSTSIFWWWGTGGWDVIGAAFGSNGFPKTPQFFHVTAVDFAASLAFPNLVMAQEMHHYVGTVRNMSYRSNYLDGRFNVTGTYPLTPHQPTTIFRLAGDYSMANAAIGSYRDLRIYDRELSAAEIWELYDPATRYALYDEIAPIAYSFSDSMLVGGGSGSQHHHIIGAI